MHPAHDRRLPAAQPRPPSGHPHVRLARGTPGIAGVPRAVAGGYSNCAANKAR